MSSLGHSLRGEQVIASNTAVDEIKRIHPKMVGVDMESYGVGLAVFKLQSDVKFVAVRGVSDHADAAKDDNYRDDALQNAAHFLIGFISSGWLPKRHQVVGKQPKYLAIQHLSRNFRPTIETSAHGALQDFQPSELIEVIIDQTDLFVNGSLINPVEALIRQTEALGNWEEIIREFPDCRLGYFGLAHIPLMFHLGYKINRREVQLFGNDYKSGGWFDLPRKAHSPSVITDWQMSEDNEHTGDALFLMSVSYKINTPEPDEIVSKPLVRVHIHSEEPHEEIIDSKEALDAFTDAFRKVRQKLISLPVERIHLFYAGQPTLAFRCGPTNQS